MGYRSKTYSLSDEVVEAIEAARSRGLTPNKFLRQLLGIGDSATIAVELPPHSPTDTVALLADSGTKREKTTVQRGIRSKGDTKR